MPSDSDPWPDEPDEPDPEERWGDPENDLIDVPAVDIPGDDADEGAAVQVDRELATTFWAVVVLVNVGVAGISIGAMVLYFRGQLLLGSGAIVVGALALVRAYYTYRGYRGDEAASDDVAASADGAGSDDDPDDA